MNALLNFKADYDANRPLRDTLPDLVQAHPARYGAMGLKDLAAVITSYSIHYTKLYEPSSCRSATASGWACIG